MPGTNGVMSNHVFAGIQPRSYVKAVSVFNHVLTMAFLAISNSTPNSHNLLPMSILPILFH